MGKFLELEDVSFLRWDKRTHPELSSMHFKRPSKGPSIWYFRTPKEREKDPKTFLSEEKEIMLHTKDWEEQLNQIINTRRE